MVTLTLYMHSVMTAWNLAHSHHTTTSLTAISAITEATRVNSLLTASQLTGRNRQHATSAEKRGISNLIAFCFSVRRATQARMVNQNHSTSRLQMQMLQMLQSNLRSSLQSYRHSSQHPHIHRAQKTEQRSTCAF